MRIANVMFSRGLGGIEQAFLDYNDALLLAGHNVLAVSHPVAEINTHIRGELEHYTTGNIGSWDPFASWRLRNEYARWKPDIIISHGNRALQLNHRTQSPAFHIALTHNYHLQHIHLADGIFAITADLKAKALAVTQNASPVEVIPNMIQLPDYLQERKSEIPVIGALGRMIPKKGFHLLLEAATLLKERNIVFSLLIGGDGEQLEQLKHQASKADLDVEFRGWIGDKASFFTDCDIFCLPSTHEPFGIVLLEAMAYGRAAVSFATEGPREIIQHNEALLATADEVQSLAQQLERLIHDTKLRSDLREKGRRLVETKYDLPVVSQKINAVLHDWISG